MTTISEFETALLNSWSLESSSLWTKNTPAAGQCGVTALVANDVLGAEVLKTRYGDLWHFYNRLDGLRYDFTDSQFDAQIVYDDIPSNREEAFGDTNASQYNYLRDAVVRHLRR
ncbi:hypothetical protein [uncultured Roseibium sp.]|uniref:YunG family protein n=1 Tax=uncultured Roseibium sp. TaxID=1936171 RepID=UPI0026184694|nr:hypothetical protein [uncultured Roseibium sp.]